MTKLSHDAGVALWERASMTEFGIAIKTKNRKSLQNALWAIRQAEGRFDNLVIVAPKGHDDEIWICHKEVKLEE